MDGNGKVMTKTIDLFIMNLNKYNYSQKDIARRCSCESQWFSRRLQIVYSQLTTIPPSDFAKEILSLKGHLFVFFSPITSVTYSSSHLCLPITSQAFPTPSPPMLFSSFLHPIPVISRRVSTQNIVCPLPPQVLLDALISSSALFPCPLITS